MNIDFLKNSIRSIVPLSEEEWSFMSSMLVQETIAKGEYLFHAGHVFNKLVFVTSGILIYYKTDKNFEEYTTDIAFPGDWISDTYSRIYNKPSFMNVKAIVDSEIITISEENLNLVYEHLPKMEHFGRTLTEFALAHYIEISLQLQTTTAKERYIILQEKHPEYIMSIPQYHLANYLGITPKSLSRIRREIANGGK